MFSAMSLEALQAYWWLIISLLGALLIFLMFVQGGQTLFMQLAKDETQRDIIINAIGRRWDLTFTTLVTFGGAFFASFPLFYSTSFGGAYWVWMLILFSFILQAVSYEYRNKAHNFLGQKTYEWFLFINGLIAPILLGAAVGTFFTGSEFIVKFDNVYGGKVISQWVGPAHGLEAALNIANLSLGLAVFFLTRVLGNLYLIHQIDHQEIIDRAAKQLRICTLLFLVFFFIFLGIILTKEGFAVNPETGEVYYEKFKYLHNLLQWYVLIPFLVGVVLFLWGVYLGAWKKSRTAFWITGVGTVLVVLALLFMAGYNNTAFYPSTADLQSSLTIHNASSSRFTLVTMGYVSLLVPFVLAYIWYTWSQLMHKKIDEADVKNDDMAY
jgi:cytochrome d ubiquinol oxidase subunit II